MLTQGASHATLGLKLLSAPPKRGMHPEGWRAETICRQGRAVLKVVMQCVLTLFQHLVFVIAT